MTPKIRLALASVLVVCALGAIAPAANAYVYWGNSGTGAIGRASLDGSSVNTSFITGASTPFGVAVDANYIYWANYGTGKIGRANLDGTGADQSFITGANGPVGMAVDANHVYWANGDNTIGRATLNGSGAASDVNQSFITGAIGASAVAVDGNYLYWTNYTPGTIGRANLDGSSPNQSFISGSSSPWGIAVDDTHIYWATAVGNQISRADLAGSNVVASFVPYPDAIYSAGVAVDANHLYWANYNYQGNSIGRSNLDGTSPELTFISGLSRPWGVAVDSLPNPTISRVGKPTKRSLKVKVGCGDTSACSLRLTGNKVGVKAALVPKTALVGAGRQPIVTLAYTRALKAALAKGGRVSVTATNQASGGVKSIVVRVAK